MRTGERIPADLTVRVVDSAGKQVGIMGAGAALGVEGESERSEQANKVL